MIKFNLLLLLVAFGKFAEGTLQATCEINHQRDIGPTGPVGKRGPVGLTGDKGAKGDAGDCNAWIEAVQRLESRVNDLQNQLELRDWSRWSSWEDCSSSCGSGMRSRVRTCLFSPNKNSCSGNASETKACSVPSCQAPTMLLNGTFGPVFIQDDSDDLNTGWKGVCEAANLSEENKTRILKTVCKSNSLMLAYVRGSEEKIFTDQIYLQPIDCQDDEKYLMKCQHDGWKRHRNCQKQLQAMCTDVKHFHLPNNQITWSLVKIFCENAGRQMCSYSDIFPFNDNIPIITGVLQGDHWVPVRGPRKDWVQIGNSGNRMGWSHLEHHGAVGWGETITTHSYKGNFFCCVSQ